jgi:hypothetical protein
MVGERKMREGGLIHTQDGTKIDHAGGRDLLDDPPRCL